MHPWLQAFLERFERDNQVLEFPTRALLERVVPQASVHARFINTLSLLEHMGSHKIMATQHSSAIDQRTLRHVAEEAHHAYFMKRQAEKAASRALEYTDADLIAAASARMYFQRLEAAMKREFAAAARGPAIYLYMSMIVEFRALWFYEMYQSVLQDLGHPMSLKRVIGEEQNHLVEMVERLESLGALDSKPTQNLLEVERRLYARLVRAMDSAVLARAA